MADIQIVKTDQGAVNARLLAREARADFRRVEAASLKVRTHFTSAEAKRLFLRMFNTLQLNAHFVSVIARTRIDHQEIEAAEAALRTDIDAVKNRLNQSLDGAEALFKAHGISSFATYDTQPLEIDVGVLSSSGRRYLEVLNQFDQLMPLLQTLEIHEVITTQALDIQRAALKRQIKDIATTARRQATALRRRMNALMAREGESAAEPTADGEAGRAAEPGATLDAGDGLDLAGLDVPGLPGPSVPQVDENAATGQIVGGSDRAAPNGAEAVSIRRVRRRVATAEPLAAEEGHPEPADVSQPATGDGLEVSPPAQVADVVPVADG